MTEAKNVLGEKLQLCCTSPITGYYRDGFCKTGGQDFGMHIVCAQVTEEFLKYTKSQGNDFSRPAPHFNFPSLKPGDCWYLCAARWQEALADGVAPPVVLEATHARPLEVCNLDDLQKHRVIRNY
ncbi:DUF2237 family protein [Trichormus azollae]|jgi:uncharacterized protein (DUF2237 family)|uniref:DUF2237 domain-containing protein n=1 Tax=Nostoc azollae (strain 0708) TaxID=551115 RepID=D7E2E2_NOSA0|nr:DUF2237 domain-containing protein [Trichormus azollae]ADI64964.1 Protein of unknown function DUF2237 ['Nostoc azollae' 0708]